jgi:hypothetical protein
MGGKQGDPGDQGAGHRADEDREQKWNRLAQPSPPPHQSPPRRLFICKTLDFSGNRVLTPPNHALKLIRQSSKHLREQTWRERVGGG